MKKAIVYVQEFEGRSVGTVAMMMEASEMDAWTHNHVSNGLAVKVEVPEELEMLPETQLKGVLVEGQWEIQKGAGFIAYDKAKRIGDKFVLLNRDVETQMKQVYNTTNPDSAVANYLTWLSMKSDPAKYANKGLVARFDVVGLSIGDPLNTSQKVTDYATALVDLADDYAIWREQQILLYVAEKSAIEAE